MECYFFNKIQKMVLKNTSALLLFISFVWIIFFFDFN